MQAGANRSSGTGPRREAKRPRRRWRRRDLIAFCAEAIVIAAGIAYLAWALSPVPSQASSTPYDYIATQAQALHRDPALIINYVNTAIAPDTYRGVLRGALGTLWAKTGDQDDRALLLQALLQKAGRPTQLVMARDGNLGVEAKVGSSGFQWAGPGPRPVSSATPITVLPGSLDHTLELQLVTITGTGPITETVGTFRTSDLVDSDLVLSYRRKVGAHYYAAVISDPRGEFVSQEGADRARGQTLILRVSFNITRGLGRAHVPWRRGCAPGPGG
jgi:hypothetical protein